MPEFGFEPATRRGGAIELSSIAFPSLLNTRSITSGTFRLYYYDEINGDGPVVLGGDVASTDSRILLPNTVAKDAIVQMEEEIVQVTGVNDDGSYEVSRGVHGSVAADHLAPAGAYILREQALVVPFVKNFFGSTASGTWAYVLDLPNIRVASAELFVTNAFGDSETNAHVYTHSNTLGFRTLFGGQMSFQIAGYLAIQAGASPDALMDTDRSVRDIYAMLRGAPEGAAVTLQLNRNGDPYATLEIADGATLSNIVDGFTLAPLRARDQLSLDVIGVGTTNPGSDLTVILRL